MNHTGEKYECMECPVGRSTTFRDAASGIEYSRTGLAQCIRCGRNNDRQVGGNFYFQDEVGQESCRLCKSSGTTGGHGCNEITGATEVGDCWGLYTIASNCKESQNIYQSVAIAYGVFLFTGASQKN